MSRVVLGMWAPPQLDGGPAVLGLDPSLTSAGIAVVSLSRAGMAWPHVTAHIGREGHSSDNYAQRGARLVEQVRGVMAVVDACRTAGAQLVMAVIEGPAYEAVGGSAFDRAALWWSLYTSLEHRGIAVAVVTPSHRQKFLAGRTLRGAEGKRVVLDACRKLWTFEDGPPIARNPLQRIVNDDEADALGLATMGAMSLKWPVPFRPHGYHVANVALVDWPLIAPFEVVP